MPSEIGTLSRPPTNGHTGRDQGELPWHHRDPFDRLRDAQARVEGLAIVSGDPALARYGVDVIR